MERRERDFFLRLLNLGNECDIETLLEDGVAILVDICGASLGYLAVKDASGVVYEHVVKTENAAAGLSTSVVKSVLETGEVVESNSALHDPALQQRESVRRLKLEAIIAVPMKLADGPTFGVVYLHRQAPGPFTPQEVEDVRCLGTAMSREARRLLLETAQADPTGEARARLRHHQTFVGRSLPTAKVLRRVRQVAPRSGLALIRGETGVGKSVIAEMIWANSPRRSGPFVTFDCGTVSSEGFTAHLFGTRKGAFTDAHDKRGLVEEAKGGVLFIDEIANTSLEVQASLLRFVDTQTYVPVGGTSDKTADVRLIVGTNANLEEAVKAGRFMPDLLQRLLVLPLHVPSLRARIEDIRLLVPALIERSAAQEELVPLPLEPDAFGILCIHPWPGNVRQLEHVLYNALTIAHSDELPTIRAAHIREALGGDGDPAVEATWEEAMTRFKRRFLIAALERCSGNRTETAKALGISRATLYEWLKQLGIDGD